MDNHQHLCLGLGIVSCVLALFAPVLFFGCLPFVIGNKLVLVVWLLAPLIALVAFILGIIGVVQKTAFAWMRVVLSVISLLIIVLYFIHLVNNFTWR